MGELIVRGIREDMATALGAHITAAAIRVTVIRAIAAITDMVTQLRSPHWGSTGVTGGDGADGGDGGDYAGGNADIPTVMGVSWSVGNLTLVNPCLID